MEQWNIVAEISQAGAYTGSTDAIAIGLCVSGSDGTPVTGLTKSNFSLAGIAGFGPGQGDIKASYPWDKKFEGFYTLVVPPVPGTKWKRGDFVVAIVAERKATKGNPGKPAGRGRTVAKYSIENP